MNSNSKKNKIQYYKEQYAHHDPDLPNCIVTDLDGTIAMADGRTYYDDTKYHTDKVNEPVLHIINTMLKADGELKLIVLTGRMATEIGFHNTSKWLFQNNVDFDNLRMRKNGDYRKDYEVKSEIIKDIKTEYNIIAAFDDRDSSAKAFRDNGVLCLQVNKEE